MGAEGAEVILGTRVDTLVGDTTDTDGGSFSGSVFVTEEAVTVTRSVGFVVTIEEAVTEGAIVTDGHTVIEGHTVIDGATVTEGAAVADGVAITDGEAVMDGEAVIIDAGELPTVAPIMIGDTRSAGGTRPVPAFSWNFSVASAVSLRATVVYAPIGN